jgi:hypothetical protein
MSVCLYRHLHEPPADEHRAHESDLFDGSR